MVDNRGASPADNTAGARIAVSTIGLLILIVGLSLIWPFDLDLGLGLVVGAIGLVGLLWAGWGLRSPASS